MFYPILNFCQFDSEKWYLRVISISISFHLNSSEPLSFFFLFNEPSVFGYFIFLLAIFFLIYEFFTYEDEPFMCMLQLLDMLVYVTIRSKWLTAWFKCLRYLLVTQVELSSRHLEIHIWNSGERPGVEK